MTKSAPASRLGTVSLIGLAAFGLTACQSEDIDARTFRDKESCVAASLNASAGFSAADCDLAFTSAVEENAQSAPRYDAVEVCEAEHGEGACVAQQTGGGGSIFLPLLAGYMIGQMLNNGGVAGKALYPKAGGGVATADGRTQMSGLGGATKVAPSALNRAAPTVNQPPMSRSTVSARGGFGASPTAAPGKSMGG